MPSQPFPEGSRRPAARSVDWRTLRSRLYRAAVGVGLATRARTKGATPPLLPGLNLQERIAARLAERLTAPRQTKPAPVAEPVAPVPLSEAWNRPAAAARTDGPDGGVFARAAARLGVLSVGTVLGMLVIAVVGVVLFRPAMSSAKALLQVELDIPEEASLPELEERSTIYDGDDNLLAVIDREVSRKSIPLKQIPRHVQHAVITAEDRKFYKHEGYDVEGIGRAMVANLQAGTVTEGGSTITQQLAKSQVGTDRTFQRKASELLYAMALEDRFTKKELLERYLNQVYFGSRAYGIAAAAEEFFHTEAEKLTIDQAALLASLIRAPNSADPRDKPRLAMRRRNAVLEAMVTEGHLKPGRLQRLLKRPLGVKESSPQREKREPHVVDAVKRELVTIKALGKNPKQRERKLYYGGLRITTTLDLEMQRTATDVIRDYTSGAPTAAIATVEPETGAIKAIASGLGYEDLEYDLPTQGRRQPGSAFKPFVYAAALQDGFPIEMSLSGKSPAYFEGVPGWERDCDDDDPSDCGVTNYGGASYGQLDMPSALQNSVNTAAAQLTITLGPKRVAKLAKDMGINIQAATNGRITESLGLGGLDHGVTPLEMAGAYAVFANNGERVKPHLIAKIEDRDGKVIYEAKPKSKEVLDPVVDAAVIDMMEGVVTGGTGTAAQLPSWPVAGKTGTTTSNVDAWFVGYTPVLSTAVWVGHAEGQIEMYGMTGGALPATIWQAYMARVLDGRDVVQFPEPDLDALADRMDSESFTVPDVVRMTEGEALAELGRKKFIGVVQTEYSSAPEGTVVWQSPRAGETATPGESVYIGVSSGYIPPPPPSGSGGGGGGGGSEEETEPATDEEKPPPEDGGTTDGGTTDGGTTDGGTTDGGTTDGGTTDGGGGGGKKDGTNKP